MGVIIVDVKLAKFEGSIDKVWRSMQKLEAYWDQNPEEGAEQIEVTEHLIQQHCFKNQRNEKVYLGAVPAVEQAIGLSFRTFTDMNKIIEEQYRDIANVERQNIGLEGFKILVKNMSRWDRFIFFFTGRVY